MVCLCLVLACFSNHLKFTLKKIIWNKTMETKIKSGVGEVMNRQSIVDFRAVKLLHIIMKDTCHYTFTQAHRMYNTKSVP